MQKSTFVIADSNLNTIASNEKRIGLLKGDAKEANGEAQTLKLNSYCQLISGIAGAPMTSKSNLPTAVSSSLKADLMDIGGLTEGMANKMVKNAVGARNVFKIGGDNITPEMVTQIFEEQGISSEAKLIKAVSGDDAKSKVQLAVDKVAGKRSTKKNNKGERIDGDKWLGGFTYDEIEEFQSVLANALRVRGEMEAAAQEAADKAQAENDAVNEMTAQLEGQAA
tara:strand:- start:163 stop:834 length:672 start_codon:yes stop_codon:yes gene_type:complete